MDPRFHCVILDIVDKCDWSLVTKIPKCEWIFFNCGDGDLQNLDVVATVFSHMPFLKTLREHFQTVAVLCWTF